MKPNPHDKVSYMVGDRRFSGYVAEVDGELRNLRYRIVETVFDVESDDYFLGCWIDESDIVSVVHNRDYQEMNAS